MVKHERIRLCGRDEATPKGPNEAGAAEQSWGLMK